MSDSACLLLNSGSSRRPAPTRQLPLPPFDPNPDLPDQFYPGGNGVASSEPPEFTAQWPKGPDLLAIRADFNAVTIPGNYFPTASADIVRNGGVTLIDGPYVGMFIPFLPGANSTPPTAIMTPMVPLYPEYVQTIVFIEHALRGYTHFIWDVHPWNGAPMTAQQAIAFDAKVRSWGFWSVIWRGDPLVNDEVVNAARSAGGCDYCIVGEEVDAKFDAVTYEEIILPSYFKLGCPLGVHFTVDQYTPQVPPPGDVGAWSYPLRPERDTFILNWSLYDGKLHCHLQSAYNAPAGLQSSLAYYARMRVNAGLGDGSVGPGAPNSRVYCHEVTATDELYGRKSELVGCLRGTEMMWAPNGGNPKIRSMGGYCNGARRPDGSFL